MPGRYLNCNLQITKTCQENNLIYNVYIYNKGELKVDPLRPQFKLPSIHCINLTALYASNEKYKVLYT